MSEAREDYVYWRDNAVTGSDRDALAAAVAAYVAELESERDALRTEHAALKAERDKLVDALENWVICFHCGERMAAPGTEEHGKKCPKHPMRVLEVEHAQLVTAIAARLAEEPLSHDALRAVLALPLAAAVLREKDLAP